MATSTKTNVSSKLEQRNFLTECVDIAIDPDLGSPFMIKSATEKGVQKGDVTSWEELAEHFGPTDPNTFRDHSVKYTITKWAYDYKKNHPGAELSIVETGGTTGLPKKGIQLGNLTRTDFENMNWYNINDTSFELLVKLNLEVFKDFNIPLGLNWLVIVPTGPHTIGKYFIKTWERDVSDLIYTIDLDPRFIKKAMMADPKIGGMYLQHLQDQTMNIVKQEFPNIQGIFTTGVLLEKMFPMVQRLRQQGDLQAIAHGGTPMPEETYKILTEDLGLPVTGYYGQSLFGTLFQTSELDGFNIDYYPHPRFSTFVISDENDISSRVNFGEVGTVTSQRVSPETVIPALVQNGDLGEFIKPKGRFSGTGVRNPHRDLSQGQQMGVY